jgi:hypothetical protein
VTGPLGLSALAVDLFETESVRHPIQEQRDGYDRYTLNRKMKNTFF